MTAVSPTPSSAVADAAPVARVLVVEDDPDVSALVASVFRREGFVVSTASDGLAALDAVRSVDPHVVVLDVGLPHLDGVDVCRRIRTFSDSYVIMLSARDEQSDLLVGLAVGADDYVTKPFASAELVARVRACLRRPRSGTPGTRVRQFGDLVIHPDAREVVCAGAPVELTRTEFDLLDVLSESPRSVFSRDALLDAVWGPEWHASDRLVDTHIGNLRRKLGDDGTHARYVMTVRGVGYRMAVASA